MILSPPLEAQRAAEGQTIYLQCEVFGSPKPLVFWRKGSEQLTGGRFKVMEEGHLQITVTFEDCMSEYLNFYRNICFQISAQLLITDMFFTFLSQDVMLVDAGTYTCTASNKFDTVSATGGLVVRRKYPFHTQYYVP